MGKKRVVIVGGGAGGIILANSLNQNDFDVTILDKSDTQIFQPAFLYAAFMGKEVPTKKTSKLIKKGIKFKLDPVKKVDLTNKQVFTEGGEYDYDYVVIATGTMSDTSIIPGLKEIDDKYGDYHTSIENAQRLWKNLNSFRGGTIVLGQASPICKCPPSPIEGMLLTEMLINRRKLKDKTKLVFFTPYPRAYSAEPMNKVVEPIMKGRGIQIMTFFDLDHIDANTLYSLEGDQINFDLPIIIPPFKGTKIDYEPKTVLDDDRFIKADKFNMRIQGFDDAFAIGDATNIPTSKAGVGAHLEAKIVANILQGKEDKFDGRTNCPFDLGYGKGTFVIGSYDQPVVPYPPSRLNHFEKMMMEKIYWSSLKGTFDFIFNLYFRHTDPIKLNKKFSK
ncbi:MAG: NAD(P)/FAD-dependent oxidoreductase [Candidatus Acidifodinimicrobium sp.]